MSFNEFRDAAESPQEIVSTVGPDLSTALHFAIANRDLTSDDAETAQIARFLSGFTTHELAQKCADCMTAMTILNAMCETLYGYLAVERGVLLDVANAVFISDPTDTED